jgi:hypothetical protein
MSNDFESRSEIVNILVVAAVLPRYCLALSINLHIPNCSASNT